MEGARVGERATLQDPAAPPSQDPYGRGDGAERDRQVRRVLVIEGAANAVLLVAKLVVGFSTGSLAVLGDALHSLTDLANNAVAWIVMRLSAAPPDRDHPYGHRKFETLAVFGLASLMTVLGIELGLSAIRREAAPLARGGWALATMLGVLAINIALAAWETAWARKLRSDILAADARHTLSDVLTTIAVIVGWQIAARGYPWLDSAFALGVAALVLYLAFGLFARAIPVLVDKAAIEPEAVARIVLEIPGVRGVEGIRSRRTGSGVAIDMVIRVRAHLPTRDAHEIADRVESAVRQRLQAHDVTVHIEPEESPASP